MVTVSPDDPRVKKLLAMKSMTREDLAVMVVTGTDRLEGALAPSSSVPGEGEVLKLIRDAEIVEECAEEEEVHPDFVRNLALTLVRLASERVQFRREEAAEEAAIEKPETSTEETG